MILFKKAGGGNRTRIISLEGWVLPLNYAREMQITLLLQ
tara:strand:+ start:473 stop:589 length:117 start_codon:yes stop_codon:yes gene_type:complete